jgi:hypothetical protein
MVCLLLGGAVLSHDARLAAAEDATPAVEAAIDYSRDIQPLLSKRCLACHGADADNRQAGLRLDQRDGATAELDSGVTAIVPGEPRQSALLERVAAEDRDLIMPPDGAGEPLSAEQVALLTRWIAQGAPFTKHWSFVQPRRVALPEVRQSDWPANAIDHFILARIEAAGLQPSPEADRHTLIRRLSLDLRGLPPTPSEVAAFVSDTRPDAYERLVDAMLADSAYGERWARMWMDLARYADSAGFGSDPLRTIWRYRDWVIDAFNRNLPFDQFTIEQLAGDLLSEPTPDQLLATAFHRNTMTNTEGGTDDEEFRVAAVKDRVDTTGLVWMGLTVGCAKCHNHKYDPISQREYYQLFAIFNQTEDNDQPNESPLIASPSREMIQQQQKIDAQLAELRDRLETQTPELDALQQAWEEQFHAAPRWTRLQPLEVKAASDATKFEPREDGSWLASGEVAQRDVYEIVAPAPEAGVTGLRLEVLPHVSLPEGGSGRAADGRFVLSHVTLAMSEAERLEQPPQGRYLRIDLPGQNRLLSLAEVQIFQGTENIAPAGKATQSSLYGTGAASLAIDGNTNGHYFEASSTTHTNDEADPWWEVDLGQVQRVDHIVVWNRTDSGLESRLKDYRVSLLDAKRNTVWAHQPEGYPSPSHRIALSPWRGIPLAGVMADSSQEGFPATDMLKRDMPDKGGWSVNPRQQQAHEAVFLVAKTEAPQGPNSRLRIQLHQQFEQAGHLLGCFRLSVSSDENLSRRAALPPEILQIIDLPAETRTAQQTEQLADYHRGIAPSLNPLREQIAALEKSGPSPPMIPVMRELPVEKRRTTHLMVKGNFLTPGEEVLPALPAEFVADSGDVTNASDEAAVSDKPVDRLALAQWLVDESNPLTARVMANRYWAALFGAGLVVTEEDFGTQGQRPSHPQLLDWLALRFIEDGWDMKALLRRIVTSSTYKQSSVVTAEALEADPTNRLLARAPRMRLEAEMVRDQALSLSGLLSRKLHGPSVFPPQPPGLWQAAFNGRDRNWTTSPGEDRYRRGLYTFWRRTVPYPSMATFDAPSREICTVRRSRTSTPLQALVTMNDPVYVEAAQALARRIMREGGDALESRLRYSLELCLARPAEARQIEVLAQLWQQQRARYRDDPAAAWLLATEPLELKTASTEEAELPEESVLPETEAELSELAAWTVVANVLLNLDGVLTKG